MDASKVQTESQRQQGQEDQPRLALRGGGMVADWLVLNAAAFFPPPPFPSRFFPPFSCAVPFCSTLYTLSLPFSETSLEAHLRFL
jgi:hypothetical protein